MAISCRLDFPAINFQIFCVVWATACHCNLSNVLNMNCLWAIHVDRNQRPFLAQMRSFVVRYDVIHHLSPINSQYLMTWEVDSPGNVFLGLTCNSQSLPPSLDKNTIAISLAILNSQEVFSVLFLRQITLWFGNPKSLQSLQNAPRDITNFAVYKETLGTFVPRHQGTCRIIPSKPAGLWKMA